MKFDILNRFTGEVQFTAYIEADEKTPKSIKIGLAVEWAVKNGASLDGASLDGANLYGASLDGASLDGANLDGANLTRASLYGASLDGAILARAILDGASLDGASLDGANLDGANLTRASLSRASLDGAILARAILDGANLYGASLDGASLDGANAGINQYIKSTQIDTYCICYTHDRIQIGCENHSIHEWKSFDDDRIINMDGKKALKFWRKYKEFIFTAIELAPASPTNSSLGG